MALPRFFCCWIRPHHMSRKGSPIPRLSSRLDIVTSLPLRITRGLIPISLLGEHRDVRGNGCYGSGRSPNRYSEGLDDFVEMIRLFRHAAGNVSEMDSEHVRSAGKSRREPCRHPARHREVHMDHVRTESKAFQQ